MVVSIGSSFISTIRLNSVRAFLRTGLAVSLSMLEHQTLFVAVDQYLEPVTKNFVDLKSNLSSYTIRSTIFENGFWPEKFPKTEYFFTKRIISLSSRFCKFSIRTWKLYFPWILLLKRTINNFSASFQAGLVSFQSGLWSLHVFSAFIASLLCWEG